MNEIDEYIEYLLFTIVSKVGLNTEEKKDLWDQYKKLKAKISSSSLINILNINNEYLNDFEKKWKSYLSSNLSKISKEVNSLRLIITLEYLFKTSQINNQNEFPKKNSNIELSIKQVRALELIIRDLIYEQVGNINLLLKNWLHYLMKSKLNFGLKMQMKQAY